ncbi:MAG: hypothetical protein AB7G80_06310 [Dongiaceae bacterium]
MSMIESVSKAGATGAAIAVWVLTAILMFAAAHDAYMLVVGRTELDFANASKPPRIEVKEQKVSEADYKAVVERVMRFHSSTKFASDRDGITIQQTDIAGYYQWLIAIYDVMTAMPDARWKTDEMCAGDACQRAKYFIRVSALRRVPTMVDPSAPQATDPAPVQ